MRESDTKRTHELAGQTQAPIVRLDLSIGCIVGQLVEFNQPSTRYRAMHRLCVSLEVVCLAAIHSAPHVTDVYATYYNLLVLIYFYLLFAN